MTSSDSSNARNSRTVVVDGVERHTRLRPVMTENFSSGSSARKRKMLFDGVEVPTTTVRQF